MKTVCALVPALTMLAACANTSTIRTSSDTAIIHASAESLCGGTGAADVAQKQAAIETIKAGFDRYVIFNAAASNNTSVTQMPGSYQTTGHVYGGHISTRTTYTPGPMIYSGSHDQSLSIKMFKDSDPMASQAVSARETLGPKWAEMVKAGQVRTCT